MRTSDDILSELRRLHPLLIDLSLGRLERLLGQLGHPERKLPPVIHVAGTNGKGSTIAFLKAIFEAAGCRVHVYTSPHLVRFNERIAIPDADGRAQPIQEPQLMRLLERVAEVNGGAPITFFEITTAAAFLAFSEMPADVVLLEVGLGGRFDATNVIDAPALTVVTPISMDHADKLGDTVEKIAFEKAGIMKRGVPCVVAKQTPAVSGVLEGEAAGRGVPLIRWGQDFDAFEQRGRLVFQQQDQLLDLAFPALIGPHQIVNAGTAIAAALAFGDPRITETAIGRGLTDARWPARMQRLGPGALSGLLREECELWLDGGHNPAGGQAIAQTLADLEERSPRPLHMVVGMMGQKDAAGFLEPFQGLARRMIAVPIPDAHEAAAAPDALVDIAEGIGLPAETADSVPAALRRIMESTDGPVRILICGSLYLAGHVLALQQGVTPQMN
ncbi:MAG: bifunctional folylpolyglutamate synthase/dihydrofolate synthase [Hyphomicrobiaceae bacterium]